MFPMDLLEVLFFLVHIQCLFDLGGEDWEVAISACGKSSVFPLYQGISETGRENTPG